MYRGTFSSRREKGPPPSLDRNLMCFMGYVFPMTMMETSRFARGQHVTDLNVIQFTIFNTAFACACSRWMRGDWMWGAARGFLPASCAPGSSQPGSFPVFREGSDYKNSQSQNGDRDTGRAPRPISSSLFFFVPSPPFPAQVMPALRPPPAPPHTPSGRAFALPPPTTLPWLASHHTTPPSSATTTIRHLNGQAAAVAIQSRSSGF